MAPQENESKTLPERSVEARDNARLDPERIEKEVKLQFFRASGPGGQHRNKVETAVRMTHPPSGIVVTATEGRSQARNRAVALRRLLDKLRELNKPRRPRHATRKSRRVKQRERIERDRQSQKKRLPNAAYSFHHR